MITKITVITMITMPTALSWDQIANCVKEFANMGPIYSAVQWEAAALSAVKFCIELD